MLRTAGTQGGRSHKIPLGADVTSTGGFPSREPPPTLVVDGSRCGLQKLLRCLSTESPIVKLLGLSNVTTKNDAFAKSVHQFGSRESAVTRSANAIGVDGLG